MGKQIIKGIVLSKKIDFRAEDGIVDHFLESLPDPNDYLAYMGLSEVEVLLQLQKAEGLCNGSENMGEAHSEVRLSQ